MSSISQLTKQVKKQKTNFYITLGVLLALVLGLVGLAIFFVQEYLPLLQLCGDAYTYLTDMFARQLVKTCEPTCESPDLEVIPFQNDATVAESLGQLYHYLDLISENKIDEIPADKIELKCSYSKNAPEDPFSCVVFRIGDVRYIIWRGTQTEAEVELDLQFRQVQLEGIGTVHKGFASLYDEIWPELKDLATDPEMPQIVVFGHSLGGAMTNLTTKAGDNIVGYASASPRVFDPETAQHIMTTRQNLYSIVNNADIIPTIPWSVMDLGPDEVVYYKALTNREIVLNKVGTTLADCHSTFVYSGQIVKLN
uniref:Fungal lipase-type domain-containing protein n=1 Tax=viral metagenome TaxID=1070528 RepID=A0A6C0BPY3_9ZZZZ